MSKLKSSNPYIIAEIGSNWRDFNDCKESVSVARRCGADAVKFQAFTGKALYGCDSDLGYQLPLEWLPKLKEKADAEGIDFMCTAFSPELLDAVNPHVSVHKIASSDVSYVDLLQRVNSKGKPVILSTGGSSLSDIKLALEYLPDVQVYLLYCVSAYPAKNVNLYGLEKLAQVFNLPIGYSCHTQDYTTAVNAARFHKARVIEKHLKIPFGDSLTGDHDPNTPDSGHSLLPDEFKLMVDHIRAVDPIYPPIPSPAEHDMITRHNRRLFATAPILKGQAFEAKLVGAFRSKTDEINALTPFAGPKLHGKVAKYDHQIGAPITPQSFE